MGEVEFDCVHHVADKLKLFLEERGIKFTVLHPAESFIYLATEKEVVKRDGRIQQGYMWCGGRCRWGTHLKLSTIEKYLKSLEPDKGELIQYVGISFDERIRAERAKMSKKKSRYPILYPLIEWQMTEAECLDYCRERDWKWEEDGYDMYVLLDRLSCSCCSNKNLRELSNMFRLLKGRNYWAMLEELQRKIPMPFRHKTGQTVFDLRARFEAEAVQMDIFDLDLKEVNKES